MKIQHVDTILAFFISFFELIFGNIFAFIAFYLLVLVSIKLFGIWKLQLKNTNSLCPKCGNKSSRINREKVDKVRNVLSLNLFKWKRYACYSCYWEGSRWD